MTEEYRKDQMVRVAVPAWHRGADEKWTREWNLQLVIPPPADWLTKLNECRQAGVDMIAELLADGRTLRLTCATELNPFTDELFLTGAYRTLSCIDQCIGEIELIEGQPRRVWQPFRTAQQK